MSASAQFRGRAAFGNVAFDNEVVLTDDGAFGNEIARMISLCSIIESNSYLRFPKSKQMKSWFALGDPDWGDMYLRSPKIKQTFILGTQGLLLFRGRAFSATEYFFWMLRGCYGDPVFLQTDKS